MVDGEATAWNFLVKRGWRVTGFPWDCNSVADPIQKMSARSDVLPLQPFSTHVVTCAVEIGGVVGTGTAGNPVIRPPLEVLPN